MSIRFSTGFINAIAGGAGYYELLQGAKFEVYSSTQPTTADTATSGALLFTATTGTYTAETKAYSTIEITSTASPAGDVIPSIKIGGTNILGSSLTLAGTTAALVAAEIVAKINANYTYPDYYAVLDSAKVVIYAPKGSGTALNGLDIAVDITNTSGNLKYKINNGTEKTADYTETGGFGAVVSSYSGAGVAAANGLTFTYPPTAGLISKNSTTWTGTSVATGTAGWFRIIGGDYLTNASDGGTTDTTGKLIRMDGSIGTSGADMIVASTSVTISVAQTIQTFSLQIPLS